MGEPLSTKYCGMIHVSSVNMLHYTLNHATLSRSLVTAQFYRLWCPERGTEVACGARSLDVGLCRGLQVTTIGFPVFCPIITMCHIYSGTCILKQYDGWNGFPFPWGISVLGNLCRISTRSWPDSKGLHHDGPHARLLSLDTNQCAVVILQSLCLVS